MYSTFVLLAASTFAAAELTERFTAVEQDLNGIGLIAPAGKTLFVYLPGAIEARHAADGTRRWRAEVAGRLLVATPDVVYVWVNDPDNKKDDFPKSRLIGLDAADGKKVFTSDPFVIAPDRKGSLDLSKYAPYGDDMGGYAAVVEKGEIRLAYRLMISGGAHKGTPVAFGDPYLLLIDGKTGKATPKELEKKAEAADRRAHLSLALKEREFAGYWKAKPIAGSLDVEFKVEVRQEAAETERGALHSSWQTTSLIAKSKDGKTEWSMVLQPRHKVNVFPNVP